MTQKPHHFGAAFFVALGKMQTSDTQRFNLKSCSPGASGLFLFPPSYYSVRSEVRPEKGPKYWPCA